MYVLLTCSTVRRKNKRSAEGEKIERKYLAHYIDAAFDMTFEETKYERIGKDLEEYNIELNPDVETKKNILGETSVTVKGYEPKGNVGTQYARYGSVLFKKLYDIINNRSSGSQLESSVVDVLVNQEGTIESAYRENVIVVPQSIGGDGGGVNIPYEIYYNGSRTKGTWDKENKKFTAGE